MSDPTRTGAPPGGPGAAYSLSEIAAQAKKAARGAGHPWGLAEEAAVGVRWLAARRLPGSEALAGLLGLVEHHGLAAMRPRIEQDAPRDGTGAWHWGAARAPACPIMLGAAWSDRAGTLAGRGAVAAGVAYPLLLLPALAQMARRSGRPVPAILGDVPVSLSPDGTLSLPTQRSLQAPCAGPATVQAGRGAEGPALCETRGESPAACVVAETVWATLERFAWRTYVPESEHSRRSGAGAGVTDRD